VFQSAASQWGAGKQSQESQIQMEIIQDNLLDDFFVIGQHRIVVHA
jgi:hypothetical protein